MFNIRFQPVLQEENELGISYLSLTEMIGIGI